MDIKSTSGKQGFLIMTNYLTSKYFTLIITIGLITTCCLNCSKSNKHKNNKKSKNLDRVETAVVEKEEFLNRKLNKLDIEWEHLHIFIRGFKQEKILEVWVKSKEQTKFQKLVDYEFCKLSGVLGPKRKEGDFQVPEGFYKIDRFNPKSNYYLSLGINYPNKSDKIRGDKIKPGSDIFIHGDCVTVGCIPITDDKIKELYVLAKQAKRNGQHTIPVHIYPAKLTLENLEILRLPYKEQISFWKELKIIHDQFESTKQVPNFEINSKGAYKLK